MGNKIKSNKNLYKNKIFVEGMHCSSCEILIEKTLKKYDGVEGVKASLDKGVVEVACANLTDVDIKRLNNDLSGAGYKFSLNKPKSEKTRFIRVEDGKLEVNAEKFKEFLKVLGILGLVFIVVVIINNSGLGRFASVDINSSLAAFLVLGVVAGLSSCAALVGSLLLVMTKQWNDLYLGEDSKTSKYQPHTLFHIGRLASFFVFGGLLGLLGQTVSLGSTTMFSIIVIAISVIMLVLSLQMLGVRQVNRFKFKIPGFFSQYIVDEKNFSGKYMPFVLGVLTFLLPCGFTLIAQGVALASASFIKGGLIMFFFALGTFPILAGISLAGVGFNTRMQMSSIFNKASGVLILIFALYTINSQLNVLGVRSLSDMRPSANETIVLDDRPDIDENLQNIVVVADGFNYRPTGSTTINAGEKTVLAVNNKGIQGCGQFMASKGLFDGYVQLKQGWNYIEFTPKKGVYKLTCTMGMVSPITITVL